MKLVIAGIIVLFSAIVIFVWIASELAAPKFLPQPSNWDQSIQPKGDIAAPVDAGPGGNSKGAN